MNFNLKIIFVTLTILFFSLLLNSFLSIASFEKIYVKSLISTTEIAGSNLKVKIEQSLRFGKPLDRFTNMDNLIEKLLEDDNELLSAGIILADGKILYHSNKHLIGKTIVLPPIISNEHKDVNTQLIKGIYNTFVPLYGRSKTLVGYIKLTFPREIVYSKLKAMAFTTINTLWFFIPLTFVGLFMLVSIFIARPIKKDLIKISRGLTWTGTNGNGNDFPNNRNTSKSNKDLLLLETHIHHFVTDTTEKMKEFEKIKRKHTKILENAQQLNALEVKINKMVKNLGKDLDKDQKHLILLMLEKQKNIRSMLDLNENFFNEMLGTAPEN
ncbi:hypothetical protein SAMN02746065_12711 [Desulfocicer vacuolatum DSM 3385]|uniref:Single cache domain-containing protein n=1 Tax=Desulfocicer vacuolatum DSM 3385 TaxID=1121400 RepID=A0A1W2E9Q4_9BACT|nr:hypothetical protein [Desulfocicer vacuolatum]SMD06267.1 hypothetical protein SAMN02746065_12711 [Desulfocicer vacuolatum DSM 3385]